MTVYFEEGFWHGLFEQEHAQSYRVCRVTFGAEPNTHPGVFGFSKPDVYQFAVLVLAHQD